MFYSIFHINSGEKITAATKVNSDKNCW
jgi:hypothetical protein